MKNGVTVVTGSFYFNTANEHTTLPSIHYIDTTGSTSTATWSITLGASLSVDASDRGTITVQEYTGILNISTTTVTASGDISGQILRSTNSSGNEGGEITLKAAPTATISTGVAIDSYIDRLRFFEQGGSSRGAYIDLSTAPAGVGFQINNRVSGFVNAGSFVTMDNLKFTVTASGNRGLSVATVSGTVALYVAGNYTGAALTASGSATSSVITYTTTPSSSMFGWSFPTAGDYSEYIFTDATNQRVYRVTLIIQPSYISNFIGVERLTG